MSKKKHRHLRKKGMPPGTLVYTGHRAVGEPLHVTTVWYGDEEHLLREHYAPEFVAKPEGVTWVDVRSLGNTEFIARVGQDFHIHPLAQEDVLDTQQRAKLEEYDNGLFFILHYLHLDAETLELSSEQLALFIGKNFLVSFQEDADDTFHDIRKRVCEGVGRLRRKNPDFLAYSMIDAVVDHYYLVLDELGNAIDGLEEAFHHKADGISPLDKARIFRMKRTASQIRHFLLPLRDATLRFYRSDSELIDEGTRLYLRDVSDHVTQILDSLDNSRDLLTNIESLYQAEVSNRLNNVMRLLTVISTIFIPLSFVAGIYGMNFDYMPELRWHYGYFTVLGGMLVAMVAMLWYFRRKKWI
ncbi:MAG: magnesium/cobalt transporter CorA [Saprospiraceae bacterium]|nr:magnesium/cobalt transporter CorA [Saprospiraceae bacterium]